MSHLESLFKLIILLFNFVKIFSKLLVKILDVDASLVCLIDFILEINILRLESLDLVHESSVGDLEV